MEDIKYKRVLLKLSGEALAGEAKSGLDVALKVLKNIDDIGICNLTSKDVVRHPLVQKIVQAYDNYENKQSAKTRKPGKNN